jgi:hypothetical protein
MTFRATMHRQVLGNNPLPCLVLLSMRTQA